MVRCLDDNDLELELLLKFSGKLVLIAIDTDDNDALDVGADIDEGAIVIVVCGGKDVKLAAATGVNVTFSSIESFVALRRGDGFSSLIECE